MRLQDSYAGQNTPFEGDQTLWLRSLPFGASVKHVTMTLNPTLYSGTVDLTVPKPILGVTMVPDLSSPPANFVEVNFHARRTLVSVTGSGGSATLQVDMGGIYVGIASDGTIATGGKDLTINFTSTSSPFALPGLTVSKFRLSQPSSSSSSSSVHLSIDSVDISSFPTNVNVRLGQSPFWVQTGEVATQITSPDFSKVLNALLATLQPQNGYYAIPFVIHSDTIACMDVSLDIEYILDQAALPPHLSEINLPYTFNRLPDVDTGLSSPSQPSVNLPDGAAPVAGACSAQINGKFQPTRVALDRADDQVGTANVLISPASSLAQQFSLDKEIDKVEDIAVTGIDLPLFNMSTDFAGLNVAMRDDDDGKPSGNVLVSTAVTIGKPLPDHSVWGSATLTKPFRITAGTKYWLVLQSQTGQAFWKATQATANGADNPPPLQASSDNGFSWQAAGSREVIAPLAALFRLRSTPDRFSIPVQLKIGQGATAQVRSLDEFAPLGKVQFNFDFADTLTTYLTASTKAAPPPCGTQDLVVNGDFANPPSDDAAIRLFGAVPNYIEPPGNFGFQSLAFSSQKTTATAASTSSALYGLQSLPFPSQKVDLSVEHFITLTPYQGDQELVPPVKIDCAGAVPAQTTLDEIKAAINRKMAPYAQAYHVSGDSMFTVFPQQGATEVLLRPSWTSTLVPTGWQNAAGQVTRFRQTMEDGSSPIVVALVDASATSANVQLSLSGANDAATSSSPGGEIRFTQRIPVAAGCAYQLGVRYLDVLSPDSNETGLASWELAWIDAQGNTLSSETGTFQAVSDYTGSGDTANTPSPALYIDTLLVAPPKAVNADLTFSNAGPDVNVLLLEHVSFVPTMQSVSNGEFLQFDATSGNAPAGWSLQSGTIGADFSSSKPILQGSTTEDTMLTQTVTVVAGASYALRVLARPNITTQASDTQLPLIQQHARVELQWKGGTTSATTISLALDGQNFMEADWTGTTQDGVTQAVLRLIQPKSSDSASLLIQSVALNRVNSAPVPLTFLSQTPGQLTVSNMHVGYDLPEAPLSAGQIVAAPPPGGVATGAEEAQAAQLAALPPAGEGAMQAGVQASVVEDTNVRMLLKTLARESPTLRTLRDNPLLIQQRFGLSDVELNALKSADLLRAGELPAQAGEGGIQTGGEQEVEGLAISGTGTIVPPTYIPGLDVSHHNGLIDWAAVAGQKYVFAFAKATEGTGFTDGQFANNWAGMKAHSILRGAYHFFRANLDATRQANHFLKVMAALQAGDLPPVLDLETTDGMSGTAILDAAATWLALVEKASGRTPIIYTSARFWRENLAKAKDPSRFGGHYPVWVAYYRHVPQPPLPVGWTSWTFWQYTDSGTVAGILVNNGKADLDRFYGTLAELRKIAGL